MITMHKILFFLMVIFLFSSCRKPVESSAEVSPGHYQGPVRLLPENPHYFEYKGNPLVLITSAEHYGALLNQAFDYEKYLETLARDGMNYTRIFAGTYAELPGESFGIQHNTLAPQPADFLTPWDFTPDGSGRKTYDLNRWNETYFARLHRLMEKAAELDIIVEFTFFTSIYRDEHWDISPENPQNNNIDQSITRQQAHTPDNGPLMQYQEKLVRKLVNELNRYDNFFFEIQNEPWADHNVPVYNIVNKEDLVEKDWTYKVDFASQASLEWQEIIAGFISDEESHLEKKHLIAQNYCNYKAPLMGIGENISILNFHYAWPEAAEWNYGFDKVIGFDESGFAGSGDQVYRRQAWRFLMSGGGLFNNLDYSFFTGYEDGTLANKAPGGGSPELRKQLNVLKEFMHGFDLANLKPDKFSVKHAPGMIPYLLSDPGKAYALFLQAVGVESGELLLRVPEGNYSVSWISTLTGEIIRSEKLDVIDGELSLVVPVEEGEIAMKIVSAEE
jgi:hypothetical protein